MSKFSMSLIHRMCVRKAIHIDLYSIFNEEFRTINLSKYINRERERERDETVVLETVKVS